jgi:hypothetical protein
MRKPTYTDGRVQLAAFGIDHPQQGQLNMTAPAEREPGETKTCPTCGGAIPDEQTRCDRCRDIGATPLTLEGDE